MKSFIKLAILLTFALHKNIVLSQRPIIEWQRGIGGNSGLSGSHNLLSDISQTSDGGYICGGTSNASHSAAKSEDSKGQYDYWIIKLDKDGKIEWDKTYGGSKNDYLYSIHQTKDGGYIVGGCSNSNKSGDKSDNSKGDSTLDNPYMDYWILKLDSNGNIEWQKTIGGALSDYLSAVRQLPNGQYIVGGSSWSGASFGIPSFDKTDASFGYSDYWILKLDETGNILWRKSYGGNFPDEMSVSGGGISEIKGDINLCSDGGFLLGGTSSSGISGNKTEANKGTFDYWLIKTDSAGNIIWQKDFGGEPSSRNYLRSFQETPDGNYIVGGYSDSDIGGDKTQNNNGTNDYWVMKLDINGNILWQKSIGGQFNNNLYSINVTNDNGFILGGESSSPVFGDKTEPERNFSDYWLVKLDRNGNIEWDMTIGCYGEDRATCVRETNDGSYIVGGYTYGGYGLDKTELIGSTQGYWILKISPCKKTVIINDTICSGQTYVLPDGEIAYTSGIFTDTLKTSRNCDSIIITNLIVRNTSYEVVTKTLCKGQYFTLSNGTQITTTGTYKDTIPNTCDSIIEYRLEFLENISRTENINICRGQTYTLPRGTIINTGGIYRDTLPSSLGCDSIIITNLSITHPVPVINQITICAGKTIILPGGSIVGNAGTYYDSIVRPGMCDSVIITQLTMSPYLELTQNVSICLGKHFILPNGRIVNQSGIYTDTIRNTSSCDSIITTRLLVEDPVPYVKTISICQGNVYILPNGNKASVAGIYRDTIRNENTCDSIVVTQLSVYPNTFNIALRRTDTIDAGASIELSPAYEGGIPVDWQWSPADYLNCSQCERPIAIPPQNITYTLVATSDKDCKANAQTQIIVQQGNVYIPQAFSPNNDGTNDILNIFTTNPISFQMRIYNRWGEVVFESHDAEKFWDGSFKGDACPEGTYSYTIEVTFPNKQPIFKQGLILLFR